MVSEKVKLGEEKEEGRRERLKEKRRVSGCSLENIKEDRQKRRKTQDLLQLAIALLQRTLTLGGVQALLLGECLQVAMHFHVEPLGLFQRLLDHLRWIDVSLPAYYFSLPPSH